MADAKKDKLQIRNSTVDFLVFTKDAHEDGIEVRVQDHDVWLTQKAIARDDTLSDSCGATAHTCRSDSLTSPAKKGSE